MNNAALISDLVHNGHDDVIDAIEEKGLDDVGLMGIIDEVLAYGKTGNIFYTMALTFQATNSLQAFVE
ncbi:MAG: hypothetical protein KAR06_03060 [Deltaproteobacteria bacterium]|nr:hypothetical protein [Deltaproteobacteria bacterium]